MVETAKVYIGSNPVKVFRLPQYHLQAPRLQSMPLQTATVHRLKSFLPVASSVHNPDDRLSNGHDHGH